MAQGHGAADAEPASTCAIDTGPLLFGLFHKTCSWLSVTFPAPSLSIPEDSCHQHDGSSWKEAVAVGALDLRLPLSRVMFPWVHEVEHLVPNWWSSYRIWGSLLEEGPNWKKQIIRVWAWGWGV